MIPEEGCGSMEQIHLRRLHSRGRRSGLGTRADSNPNNLRYWSSRSLPLPWRGGATYGATSIGPQNPNPPKKWNPLPPQSVQNTPGTFPQEVAVVSFLGARSISRRGLPTAVANRLARLARRAARKWLPRERRWKARSSESLSISKKCAGTSLFKGLLELLIFYISTC